MDNYTSNKMNKVLPQSISALEGVEHFYFLIYLNCITVSLIRLLNCRIVKLINIELKYHLINWHQIIRSFGGCIEY